MNDLNVNAVTMNHGTALSDGPVTTSLANEYAPGLLLNEIDKRVTKIRPTATPIDQISRLAGARSAKGMTVEYYTVDTKPDSTTVNSVEQGASTGDQATWVIKVKDNIFEESETAMFPTVKVDGASEEETLTVYVMATDPTAGSITVVPLNSDASQLPDVRKGSAIVRMGRAATELDVQTAQFGLLPKKESNFCQIFKMQVEESTYQKMAAKETSWNFSDQEEAAVQDMRLGMEKNFLFGLKKKLFNPVKREEVMMTGGIWYQAAKDFTLPRNASHTEIVDMMKNAFTGGSGSSRKVLVGGSELIAELSKGQVSRVLVGQGTHTRWGIEFDEIRTNFGILLVKHSEVFDLCGRAEQGLVIDPVYLTKFVHVPFSTERLDLRKSGVRNTDAVVVTEASCLVLRYPSAHMRVKLA